MGNGLHGRLSVPSKAPAITRVRSFGTRSKFETFLVLPVFSPLKDTLFLS